MQTSAYARFKVTTLVTKGVLIAGRVRHLVNRSVRYDARGVVSKDLRGIIGKTEPRIALGGDYREALKLFQGAVTQIPHQIAVAEQKAIPIQLPNTPARYPLAQGQIAHSHYCQRMAIDDQLRNDPRHSAIGIDDRLVDRLRAPSPGMPIMLSWLNWSAHRSSVSGLLEIWMLHRAAPNGGR
ncbi:hypothetical protein [Ruegeria sp. MALMAid1280]|uniref:hypothetical protein n=1 Tax=Ruegeria sp. MALMAid1280 TaxID=3411634 RepID=UPI003BA337CA